MGLKRAFESLISEGYGSFILIAGCIAVGISYCADNGHYNVFESHARDIYGKSHPQGACSLLDIIFIIYRRLSASALHSKFIWSK